MKDNNKNKDLIKKDKKDPGKIKHFFIGIGEKLKNKWLLKISTTIIIIAILLAVYILLTYLMKEKLTLAEWDFTQNKIYTLSEESETKVKNIDKDVVITLVNQSENDSVLSFVDKYKRLNDKITVEKVDKLSSRPDLVQKYSLEESEGLIIVSSGENEKAIYDDELYTYDYTTYETVDLTEQAITNAIVSVTTDNKPKIYFMSNHLMYNVDYYETIIDYMEDEANEVESIDLFARGKLPDDCDCLVITTLKEDITEKEKDEIISYINKGGNILLMCGPNLNGAKLENFQKILDVYGMKIGDGVIFEEDNNNMLSGYPDLIVEEIDNHDIFKASNMKVCLIDATNIVFDEDKLEELNVSYEPIVSTSEKAFIRTNLKQNSVTRTKLDSDYDSYIVAASVVKNTENEKESNLIFISDDIFAMNQILPIGEHEVSSLGLYNNKDIILNSIAYLNDREDLITIRKNYDEVETYTATKKQNNIIMTIIFGLPLLIIIAGIIIWQVRRRKNGVKTKKKDKKKSRKEK